MLEGADEKVSGYIWRDMMLSVENSVMNDKNNFMETSVSSSVRSSVRTSVWDYVEYSVDIHINNKDIV